MTGKTILLVEDDTIISLAEKRQLTTAGYSVIVATSGERAVSEIRANGSIDLVLMDIDLGPGIAGTEAAQQILELREIPIVFLTSHGEKEMVEMVKGITRYGYILKASGKFVLLEQVATAFELFDAHRKLAASERRYEYIASHTSDGVLVYENGTFSYASPSVTDLLGYPAEDYYHESVESALEWIHPDDRGNLLVSLEAAWDRRATSERLTVRVLRADETYRLLETNLTCSYNADGSLELMVASFRDITDRNERELTLQASLEGAENRYQTIADNVPGMVYEFKIDSDGTWSFPYLSRGAYSYYGLDPEAVQSDASLLIKAVHPEDRVRTESQVESSLAEMERYEITHRIVRPDGDVRWINARSMPRSMPDGSTVWTGVSVDVTARLAAEQKIAEQEQRLRAVFSAAGVGIVETEADGTILQTNPQFAELVGRAETSLAGENIRTISHRGDASWEQEQLVALTDKPGPSQLEYRKRFYDSDGAERWVHVHAARIVFQNQPLRYVFVVTPVQDYRRAGVVEPEQSHVEEPEHYLKAELYRLVQEDPAIFDFLQEGSLDGIWYWDIEHPEQEWMSPRFWEILGYDPATKRHDPAEWQNLIHPDDLKESLDNFAAHVADPEHPYDQLVRYTHRDGSTVWVRCRGIAVRDAAGNAVRMLGTHNEFTRLKETEMRLREAVEAKSQLMTELHHRVKNNLAMVHGLLAMKAATLGDEVDLSDTISQVDAILTAHRLLAVDGEQDEVDLPSYLHDLLSTLFASSGSGVKWTLEAPPIRVTSGPAVKLGLILNELGINARKHAFTSDDDWFAVRSLQSGDRLELSVSNGGRELPKEFSLESSAGLGIGLIQGMVRQLNGSLAVHRRPTTFVISLPSESLTRH